MTNDDVAQGLLERVKVSAWIDGTEALADDVLRALREFASESDEAASAVAEAVGVRATARHAGERFPGDPGCRPYIARTR